LPRAIIAQSDGNHSGCEYPPGMPQSAPKRRDRGSIERRGNSFRVKVYAGLDPLTGRRLYLTDSTTDEREAERIRTRLQADVDAKRNGRTRGTLGMALDKWLGFATHAL
jgi:integrase